MANIEIATTFGEHARYLIASEELEPGGGWNYDEWYGYLVESPGATGAELGSVICDTYYEKCAEGGEEGMATLSVTDLSMANDLYAEFIAVAMSIKNMAWDNETNNAEIIREVQETERYGGDTESEGYTNLVDVGHMVSNISNQMIDSSDSFLQTLQQAVIYHVNGPYRTNSSGLSVFYPMMIDPSDEEAIQALYEYIETFGVEDYGEYICGLWGIPYDSAPAESSGSGADASYDDSGEYDESYDDGSYTETARSAETGGMEFVLLTANGEQQPAAPEGSQSGGMAAAQRTLEVKISEDPSINDDGFYNMTIDPATLDNVKEVSFSLYLDLGDEVFCYLGSDNDLTVDWKTGYVEDNFRGVWPSIDGQYVMFDLVQSTDDYIIYSIPIKLNGEETNLRVIWEWDDPADEENYDGRFVVWGAWDGIDSKTGMASRDIKKIRDGDVIIPLLYAYVDDDSDEMVQVDGDPVTVQGELKLVEEALVPGDYWYNFTIEDLMGKFTYTDFAIITIDESGEMYIE
jgi:hypothetical protein